MGFISLSKWLDISDHLGIGVEALSCGYPTSQEGSAPANVAGRESRASCLFQVFLRKKKSHLQVLLDQIVYRYR